MAGHGASGALRHWQVGPSKPSDENLEAQGCGLACPDLSGSSGGRTGTPSPGPSDPTSWPLPLAVTEAHTIMVSHLYGFRDRCHHLDLWCGRK